MAIGAMGAKKQFLKDFFVGFLLLLLMRPIVCSNASYTISYKTG